MAITNFLESVDAAGEQVFGAVTLLITAFCTSILGMHPDDTETLISIIFWSLYFLFLASLGLTYLKRKELQAWWVASASVVGVFVWRACTGQLDRASLSFWTAIAERMPDLPSPEPGWVPGGFHQDVNEQEFRDLTSRIADNERNLVIGAQEVARIKSELGGVQVENAALKAELQQARDEIEQEQSDAMLSAVRRRGASRRPTARYLSDGSSVPGLEIPPMPVHREEISDNHWRSVRDLKARHGEEMEESAGHVRRLKQLLEVERARVRLLEGQVPSKESNERDAAAVAEQVRAALEPKEARIRALEEAAASEATTALQLRIASEAALSALESEKSSLSERLARQQAELESEREDALKLLQAEKAVSSSVSREVAEREAEIADLKKEVAEAQAGAKVAVAETAEAGIQADLRDEEDRATQTVPGLATAHVGVQTDLPVTTSSSANKEELVEIISHLEGQVQGLQVHLAAATAHLAATESGLAESNNRFGQLEYAYNKTASDLRACEVARQQAVAGAIELQKSCEVLQAYNHQGNKELESLKLRIDKGNKELERLKGCNDDGFKEVIVLREQLLEGEELFKQRGEEKAQLEGRVKSLLEEKDRACFLLEEEKKRAAQAGSTPKQQAEEHRQQILMLTAEGEDLRAELKAALEDHRQIKGELQILQEEKEGMEVEYSMWQEYSTQDTKDLQWKLDSKAVDARVAQSQVQSTRMLYAALQEQQGGSLAPEPSTPRPAKRDREPSPEAAHLAEAKKVATEEDHQAREGDDERPEFAGEEDTRAPAQE